MTVQLRKSNLRHERLDPKKDDGLRRYIVACAVAALAAGIRVTLALTIEPRPPMLVMSTGAVGVAAWFGGFGPGLLATGLCSLLGLFFVDPQFSVDFEHASDLIDVGIFVFVGIGVSWLCESLRVARDRADRAMKQAELLSAREHERLMEADRRKDEFIALLAHELRNPLAPLRNVAAILRCKSHSSPEYFRCLDLLERQVRQMARLLDDLLDISRVTRGRLQLQRQPTGLTKVLRDVIEGAESSSVAKGLTVEISCPPEEIILDADPVRLTQIFSNLMTNAIKFTDHGGRIELRVVRVEHAVEISVRDSGIGIEPEYLPHLFERFSQSPTAIERGGGGLGLGLALTRRLIEKHGGTIRASSGGPGQGSEFVVRLPISEAPASEAQELRAEAGDPRSLRVLVADDNADAAESLDMLLRAHGCEVRLVHDGEAAVLESSGFRPDIVFLDIGMPRMDGYEACRRIRESPSGHEMVLVALTGWGQDRDRRRSAEAGFDRHMTKPADPESVLSMLSLVRRAPRAADGASTQECRAGEASPARR